MARADAPPHIRNLFTLRVSNIPPKITNEELMQDFSKFGEIGDFYRPVLLHKHQNSTVAFVRYKREEDGRRAEEAMNGKMLEDNEIVVCQAIQPVFFTHDTGYLTNYELNVPPREAEEFDSSLPENHYDMKRKEELKATDKYYTVRVDDLHPAISQEILADIFSEYGEIARVYVPVDLDHNCRSKGFAFVRFVKEADARRAAEEMNGIHLGIGRPITTKLNYQKSYFSQDESPPPRPRKKPGVVMHFDP